MKKTFATLAIMGIVVLLSSCDDKLCYCYERVSSTQVNETHAYVHTDTPCSSLSNESRGCIESYERGSIDPNDIAK